MIEIRLPNGYGGIRKLSGKRRNPYQVVVTAGWELKDGKAKQIQKPIGYYPTRADALNALAEYNVNPIDIDKTKYTFAEIWEKFLLTQAEKSESKQRNLLGVYKRSERLHNKALSQITLAELQRIVDGVNSYSYKSQFIVAYRQLYDYAFRNGYIKTDIAKLLKNSSKQPKPKVNVFTQSEISDMPRYFDLFFYTGMRVGEMLAVEYEDIDFERDIILVKGTKTKNALRYIPIHPAIRDTVHSVKQGEKVWKYHGCYTKLYQEFVKCAPGHKPHDTRKTFATVCYLSGVDDIITKRLMGHAVSDITHSAYIKNDDVELLRTAIEKLDFSLLHT